MFKNRDWENRQPQYGYYEDKNPVIDVLDILEMAKHGEYQQRLIALDVLIDLARLGILINPDIIRLADDLKSRLIQMTDGQFISGVYIIRFVSGSFTDKYHVGSTENWERHVGDLETHYGKFTLLFFVGISNASEAISLVNEIEHYYGNFQVGKRKDFYYLSDEMILMLHDEIVAWIKKEHKTYDIYVSPTLNVRQPQSSIFGTPPTNIRHDANGRNRNGEWDVPRYDSRKRY